jgi:hypothetical protein
LIRTSAEEMALSTTLNRLIGEMNCEAMLLPDRRATSDWPPAEVGDAVVECQSAMIAALRCALDLEALGQLDAYSRAWIRDVQESCDRALEKLQHVYGVRSQAATT